MLGGILIPEEGDIGKKARACRHRVIASVDSIKENKGGVLVLLDTRGSCSWHIPARGMLLDSGHDISLHAFLPFLMAEKTLQGGATYRKQKMRWMVLRLGT